MAPVYSIGFMILFFSLFVGALSFGTNVIGPWLDRRRKRQERQDALQERLDTLLMEQQVQLARQGWEEVQAHKKRMERNLDELHEQQ